MSRPLRLRRLLLPATALLLLAGCAGVTPEQTVRGVNDEAAAFTEGRLALARSGDQRAAQARTARELLAAPLGQAEAVRLALAHSPALQALLAQGWAESAEAAQAGRIANPVFSFERMAAGDGLELARTLSVGLLDLLSLPQRQRIADARGAQARLRLSAEVVDQVTQVRQAWVRAVAARQARDHARQVRDSAEAGAELARRLQAVGNFSRLARLRQQGFYADAATRLAAASHAAVAAREELVRLLGLDEAQAQALQLPERLPELPKEALAPQAVAALAPRARLDIRLAQATLEAAARAQGLDALTSRVDIELAARRDTAFDSAAGTRTPARGYEIALRLPLFDTGGAQRDAMDARTLAAALQLEATSRAAGSRLRESYSAYRTAHDIARHQREEVLALRQAISQENLLRYNGMLIGVFELLADAREQIGAVSAAIDAQQQFWLADAALQAELVGRPITTRLSATAAAPETGMAAAH